MDFSYSSLNHLGQMSSLVVSKDLAKKAKLAANTVRRNLKYMVDEGFAKAEYHSEHSTDILWATITLLPNEPTKLEIE